MKLIFLSCCAIVILLGYHGANAIECYVCNSNDDSRCADENPPDALKKDCGDLKDGPKFTMCRKITQVIEFSVNGLPANTRVIRSCGWIESSYKGKCYQRSGFGGRQEVCSCLQDYCNGSTTGADQPPKSFILSCALGVILLAIARN
ncbi:PREDICTED: uncharacterized protein LOC106790247 [Polistes canadensis]|uniref:uncharacterized protein LOC106790247 n=1 Tax=Polistes canadensis TaxID=91411 RepID=UPI000718FB9B|nr:PREDICTED: uncharacterized protein LOC106790247 [Polistes canadensis]KAI4493500.1 hypothetical protein M0804_001676 [Polistes exclamans]